MLPPVSHRQAETPTEETAPFTVRRMSFAKGGRYEVEAASGNRYEVDIIGQSCTCPDWQQRAPDKGCKHMRRVDHEIKQGQVPRPDGQLPPQV